MEQAIPQAFWDGIDQFNRRDFYDCHDTLEAIWMEADPHEKSFYQGILQIAVACYHLGNHNWRGAVTLLGEGIYRLNTYQPSYHAIDVQRLVDDSRELLRMLQEQGAENVERISQELFDRAPGDRPSPSADVQSQIGIPAIARLDASPNRGI